MPSKDLRQILAVAVAHHQAGRLAEAEAAYREILSADPDHIDALHLLGVVETQRGRHEAAVGLIERAIALRKVPAAELHSNVGLAYRGLGRHADAIRHFERALALKPDYAEALSNLAAVLRDTGVLDAAETHCRRAVALRPGSPTAHFALGAILQGQRRLPEAAAAYEEAIRLRPGYPEAHNNLGVVRQAVGDLTQAAAAFDHAIRLRPAYAEAHYNLGALRQEEGRNADALAEYERALALKPDYADAHWNEGLIHLTLGDYAKGWEKYEWRWRRKGLSPRPFSQPAWNGENLAGRSILLHADQGVGDTIQFVRYAQAVKAQGAGSVIVECQPSLADLLSSAAGVDRAVAREAGPLPGFDCHAPLSSLPYFFGTTLETIPAEIPYLRADPGRIDAWRRRVGSDSKLTVGLAWRGNPNNSQDLRRSIAARTAASLCGAPGVDWISLQVDARPDELACFSPFGTIRDFGPQLMNWAETAALIACLDLVISVDTAVAHLAGALGKPAWVLLSSVAHWCWTADGAGTPWYPGLTLMRQPSRGNWAAVIEKSAAEVERRAAAR